MFLGKATSLPILSAPLGEAPVLHLLVELLSKNLQA
jgi:hypothetical protein